MAIVPDADEFEKGNAQSVHTLNTIRIAMHRKYCALPGKR